MARAILYILRILLRDFYPQDAIALEVPLPPLDTQRAIVAEIEAEKALVAANRELIERFEKKLQANLACIWGEEEPAAVEG